MISFKPMQKLEELKTTVAESGDKISTNVVISVGIISATALVIAAMAIESNKFNALCAAVSKHEVRVVLNPPTM